MSFERFDGKAFFPATQEAVELLESITPVDKASSVPFLKLYEVDSAGKPVHQHPINVALTSPPEFGRPVDRRFSAERPAVSLERMTVKTEQNIGIQLFHHVELVFVVHRPDVVFGEDDSSALDADSWSSLLLPGKLFVAEYGWSGASANGMVNGDGFQSGERSPGQEGFNVVVPGRRFMLFAVVNYTFHIRADSQIEFTIQGIENGEYTLRQAQLGALQLFKDVDDGSPEFAFSQSSSAIADVASLVSGQPVPAVTVPPLTGPNLPVPKESPRGKAVAQWLQNRVDRLETLQKKGVGTTVKLGAILDEVFDPLIRDALRAFGFQDVFLRLGKFNHLAGTTAPQFGGKEMGDADIGEFEVPKARVQTILGQLRKLGTSLTLYNTLEQFLNLVHDPKSWQAGASKKGADKAASRKEPKVVSRLISTRKDGRSQAYFYVFDVISEITKLGPDDFLGIEATHADILAKLRKKGVPVVSFLKGMTYIVDAGFEVQQDDFIKTILIQESLRGTRSDVVHRPDAARRAGQLDPRQLLYASALEGDLTMLGNFVFDMFAAVWVDFGIPRWDGLFLVAEKEETIEPGGFTTRIHLRSATEDPLGTRGQRQRDQLKTKAPSVVPPRTAKNRSRR